MASNLTQISLNMYSVRSTTLPFGEQLARVRDIGYQSIQGGRGSGLPKEQLKGMLDALGMEMSAYGGDLDDIDKNTDAYIEECHYFDCDEIMIGCMPTVYRENADTYMAGIGRMNEVGRKLAKGGVFLSYHNHSQEFRRFSNGRTGMDLLFDNLDPTAVHFLLDTHWIQAGGADVIAWIQKCKDRMQYIHLKDYRIGPTNYNTGIGQVDKEFAEVGEGNLPWPLILETCLNQGIKSFIVEQDHPYGIDPFTCVKTSYDNLIRFGLK